MKPSAPFGTWKCPHCSFIGRTRRILSKHKHEEHPNFCKIGWAKGLTKETSESLRKVSTTFKQHLKDGTITLYWLGKHHSEESKHKISEGQKLAHKEGRNSSWIGRRKLSYAEQSWFNIFLNEFGEQNFINNFYVKDCNYWLDFAWPKKKIYFEVDGKSHFTKEGIEHDKIRTEKLSKVGWTLIGRCNWSEYQKLSIEDKEAFVKEIVSKIKSM